MASIFLRGRGAGSSRPVGMDHQDPVKYISIIDII